MKVLNSVASLISVLGWTVAAAVTDDTGGIHHAQFIKPLNHFAAVIWSGSKPRPEDLKSTAEKDQVEARLFEMEKVLFGQGGSHKAGTNRSFIQRFHIIESVLFFDSSGAGT
jgi:hypothetical protein